MDKKITLIKFFQKGKINNSRIRNIKKYKKKNYYSHCTPKNKSLSEKTLLSPSSNNENLNNNDGSNLLFLISKRKMKNILKK